MSSTLEIQPTINNQNIIISEDTKAQANKIFNLLDVKEATIKDYKSRIGIFLNFIKNNKFNNNSFLEFKRHLADKIDLSINSKNKYLITAKILLNEYHRMGILPVDITKNIKTFRQSKKHKKDGLNESEINILAETIRELPDNKINSRLKLLFCLFALNGFRQCEVIRLNVEDISFANKTVLIQGKGCDDKEIIHLSPETIKALKNYIKINKIKSGALFNSLGNRKSKDNRLNSMTIKREFKKIFEPLGIEKSVHSLRHSYTTTLLKKLKDVNIVRKFTRHKSLDMLIVYDDEIDIQHRAKDVFKCFSKIKVMT